MYIIYNLGIYNLGSLISQIATVLFFLPQTIFDKYLMQPDYFCFVIHLLNFSCV